MLTILAVLAIWFCTSSLSCHGLTWVINSKQKGESYLLEYKDHPLRFVGNHSYLTFLRGKTVVFIGDSLTRYQFMSLASFLYRGSWDIDHDLPSLTNSQDHMNPRWPNYYYESTLRLGCSHMCDCIRKEDNEVVTFLHEHIYHYDVTLDFLMSFHFFSPTMNMTFYQPYIPSRKQLLMNCIDANASLTSLNFMLVPHQVHRSYTPANIAQFISTELKAIKPSAIFFNQGFWQLDSFRYPSNMARLAAALRDATRLPFWKVTTEQKKGLAVDNSTFLHAIQSYELGLYDTYAITKDLRELIGGSVFFDRKRHFVPFVYREANIVLLELMRIAFSKDHASSFPLVGRLPTRE
ncbi:hypothetical protein EON65_15475 [archaeon]|nr:MAG: hypothetical protein EON65_15475 [archaeon]